MQRRRRHRADLNGETPPTTTSIGPRAIDVVLDDVAPDRARTDEHCHALDRRRHDPAAVRRTGRPRRAAARRRRRRWRSRPMPAVATPDDSVDDVVAGLADAADPVIVLDPGTYPPITIRDGGPLTIVGYSRDDVTVAGFVLDGAHDVTISGLTIAGNEDPAVEHGDDHRPQHAASTSRDLTIDPLHNAGVAIIDGSSDVVVEHSRITGEHVTRKLGPARNVLLGEGSPDTSRWVERDPHRGQRADGRGGRRDPGRRRSRRHHRPQLHPRPAAER